MWLINTIKYFGIEFIIFFVALFYIWIIFRNNNKQENGYRKSLMSNMFCIPFWLVFLYIYIIDIQSHKFIPNETGADWEMIFYIVFFGPFQIIFTIIGIHAINLYIKDTNKEKSMKRKLMHYLNIINIICIIIITLIV